jgi:hypothetical protein
MARDANTFAECPIKFEVMGVYCNENNSQLFKKQQRLKPQPLMAHALPIQKPESM